mmetsp:Transcript_20812/g.41385  ORF Transcript_20812/g.41385 Transcript_20812/m.41385 type:complete len:937 (+) Transcript_20812:92-2902(+)
MQTKPRVDAGRMEEAKASFSRLSSGPLARSYCLALSTTLLSATAFFCLLASGLSCSFLSVSLTNPNAVIDLNTTNIPPEDQWYYDELMSEDNNALSVGILCQGDLDWLAPNTSDNSMRLLSKVFLIVALALGGLLLIVTCGISTFLPASNLVWDGISYIAAGMFVCEMPIFFLLDSPPCNNYRGMFSCQLASGSYSLIVSMVCSLSLAILTQWKYTPDWKGEYEIWNLRRLNEEMNQQPGFIGGSKTPEENSNDYEDEEMAMANQQQFNQRQQQHHQDEDEPAEIGVEIRVEKVPSLQRPQRSSRAIDQKENHLLTGQVIDVKSRSKSQQVSNPTKPLDAPSVDTEVYGSDHGRNVMKEPSTPDCQFRANGIRPVSPLSTCTGLSESPGGRNLPATSPNDLSHITDKATFMENETLFMEEQAQGQAPSDFASAYLVRLPAKMTPTDDASVQSASKQSVSSKQSIVSMMRDKLWKSSNDGQIQGSALDGDREVVQEGWMVEDMSVGNSVEVSITDKAATPQPVKPQAHLFTDLTQSQQSPPRPKLPAVESDTEKDIAGLIVPGMISQMKQQIANKPVVSPERVHDPDLDMYPSESSVSELSLPNVEDEEYLKRIEQEYLKLKKSKPAEPILDLPINYQSESSGGESELDQVIAGVQRVNRKTSGKITPLNRRARRRRTGGGGSVSGDSYSSAQGSLLDEVIVEEGENNSTEISVGSGGIPNMISPEIKSRKSRQSESIPFVPSYDDDDGYQNEQSAEEDDDVQSVTSSVASARRYRLALNRKVPIESDGTPERKSKSSTLEEFLDSEAGVSNEEKVKLLQEALNRLQKTSPADEGYVSAAKSEKSQRSLTRVNQRYGPKAETIDLPLNVRNTPHAQDVNTGAAPTPDKNRRDSAWQARKARLKRLRMLRAEEANDSTDEIIRANEGIVVCASDEGSI